MALGLAVGLAQLLKYNGWLIGAVVVLAACAGMIFDPRERDRGRLLKVWTSGLVAVLLAAAVYWPWFRFVELTRRISPAPGPSPELHGGPEHLAASPPSSGRASRGAVRWSGLEYRSIRLGHRLLLPGCSAQEPVSVARRGRRAARHHGRHPLPASFLLVRRVGLDASAPAMDARRAAPGLCLARTVDTHAVLSSLLAFLAAAPAPGLADDDGCAHCGSQGRGRKKRRAGDPA